MYLKKCYLNIMILWIHLLLTTCLSFTEEAPVTRNDTLRVFNGCTHFRDGVHLCSTGNVTDGTLYVECTLEGFRLGADVTIRFVNYRSPKLSCIFTSSEVTSYACSVSIGLYHHATTAVPPKDVVCYASYNVKNDHQNQKHTVFNSSGLTVSQGSLSSNQYKVTRSNAILNCIGTTGYGNLAWNLEQDAGNTTRVLQGGIRAFCMLGCHTRKVSKGWRLEWKLNDEVLEGMDISSNAPANLSLVLSLTQDDEGKELICLYHKSNGIGRDVQAKLSTKLVMNELHTGSLSSNGPEVDSRISATVGVAIATVVMLVVIAIAVAAYLRIRPWGCGRVAGAGGAATARTSDSCADIIYADLDLPAPKVQYKMDESSEYAVIIGTLKDT